MPFRKGERAIAYMLRVLASIAKTHGRELVLVRIPEKLYVPVIGRSLDKYTVKRYAEHILRYCRLYGHSTPIRKEYLRDPVRGKILKLVIDPRGCLELAEKLHGEYEFRKQIRRAYNREIDNLRKKLKRYEKKLLKIEQKQAETARNRKEEEKLKARIKSLEEENKKLKNIIKGIAKLANNGEIMIKCIKKYEKADRPCRFILKILDTATTILEPSNAAPVDIFVDRYESDEEFQEFIDELEIE